MIQPKKIRNMSIPVKTAEALDKYCALHLIDTGEKTTAVKTIVKMTEALLDKRLERAESACLTLYQFFPEGGLSVGVAGRQAWDVGREVCARQEKDR